MNKRHKEVACCMKKTLLIACGIILALIVFAGAYIYNYFFQPRSIDAFIKVDPAAISKLLIVDGTTGERYDTIDKTKIEGFFELMNGITFKRLINQSPRSGYTYAIILYSNDKKVFGVSFAGSLAIINDTYYTVNGDVLSNLKEYHESLKNEHLPGQVQ